MKIVIAYDGSIHAGIAVDGLQRAGLPVNAEAIVLSIIEEGIPAARSFGTTETDYVSKRMAQAEERAEEACGRLTNYFPQWDIQLETRWGNPAEIILDKASGWPADLVVVGTHGRSKLGRAVLGSVSMKVVQQSPCSVRVGRAGKSEGPIRVLIGNDGSPQAERAVEEVCSRSWPMDTEARILTVDEALIRVNVESVAIGQEAYTKINEVQRQWLQDTTEELVTKLRHARLLVSSAIEEGAPKDVLLEAARNWNADVIFVGARGLGRMERLFLGSVSSACVSQAPCSVEVIRQTS